MHAQPVAQAKSIMSRHILP